MLSKIPHWINVKHAVKYKWLICGIFKLRLFVLPMLPFCLTHWGRLTHICVSKQTSIDSDIGLSPGRRQAIIWTNAGILLIEPLGTNFSEILIDILTFSIKKMRLKVSSAKRQPFCLGLNVLKARIQHTWHLPWIIMSKFLLISQSYFWLHDINRLICVCVSR